MRRRALLAFSAAPLALRADPNGAQRADPIAALRAGGVALLLRHAQTEAGVGDPPQFRLGDCATQRNLSADGRAQAQRIGAWLAVRGLRPVRVRSSAWCRCLDTARLAFGGEVEVWSPLASTFDAPQHRDAQAAELRAALAVLPARGFEAWVTHQVNIRALLDGALPMGHGIVARARRGADGGIAVHNLGALAFE